MSPGTPPAPRGCSRDRVGEGAGAGAVPAGPQQLAAAVEAELQVVALQLRLLHAH